jgi:hypothetical protein
VKLSKNLFIPIIPKAHDAIKTKFLALFNSLIEEWVIHPLKIFPINILARNHGSFALAHDNRGVEILMQLTPKSPFQVFSLLILVNVLLACIRKCHSLLEIIPPHSSSKLSEDLRTVKLWTPRILALILWIFNLKTRRSARADIPSNSPS